MSLVDCFLGPEPGLTAEWGFAVEQPVLVSRIGTLFERDLYRVEGLVDAEFDVSREELHSKRRTERIAYARFVAMHLLRKLDYKLARIGTAFGRDHGTVLYALDAVQDRRVEMVFNEAVSAMEKELGVA